MNERQEFEVEVSIAECAAGTKNDFRSAAFEQSYEVLKQVIEAGLEAEMTTFVGAEWHERKAAERRTTRAGAFARRLARSDRPPSDNA